MDGQARARQAAGMTEPAWPAHALPRLAVVNGYRLERVLGHGGFGITYLARDLLDQEFAIKEYFPRQFAVRQGGAVQAASSAEHDLFEECRARFLKEAQALVRLGSAPAGAAGIVRVLTYFEAHGTAYMVMEHLEGDNLQRVLRRHPAGLPPAELRTLLDGLLAGVRLVHAAGLMHRDIKPANIIIRPDGHPVLIDFGSTRDAATTGNTITFTQIFSPGYAPIEQVLGRRQGAYSDLYALGAVGYAAIGGQVVDALIRHNAVAEGHDDPLMPAVQVGAGTVSAGAAARHRRGLVS